MLAERTAASTSSEKGYVLVGTRDEEIMRQGLQPRAWRSHALAAWEAASIGSSRTVLDVGCGPGYASLDLRSGRFGWPFRADRGHR